MHDAEFIYAARCLTTLVGEIHLSDEPVSDPGTDGPESRLVSLLDQLRVVSEPTVDLELVGSTDPMLVDSNTASLDAFPTNVVVYDEPLPRVDSGGSNITEVLVISHGEHSGGGGQDPLQAALRDLAAPIPEDTDGEALEEHRKALYDSAQKLAVMRRLSEAYQHEVDRAIGGTPAGGEPSHVGIVWQRGATIASMLGADRPV